MFTSQSKSECVLNQLLGKKASTAFSLGFFHFETSIPNELILSANLWYSAWASRVWSTYECVINSLSCIVSTFDINLEHSTIAIDDAKFENFLNVKPIILNYETEIHFAKHELINGVYHSKIK